MAPLLQTSNGLLGVMEKFPCTVAWCLQIDTVLYSFAGSDF